MQFQQIVWQYDVTVNAIFSRASRQEEPNSQWKQQKESSSSSKFKLNIFNI
jgi:hypothetical protein